MTDGIEEVPAWAIRLEAKLDVALAQHAGRIDNHDREIEALRTLHATSVAKCEEKTDGLDSRLDVIERTPAVTPKGLAVTLSGVIAALGVVAPFLDRIYS